MTTSRFPRLARIDALRIRGAAAQIGAALRRARESRGLSQGDAADAAAMWQTALSRLEHGHVRGVQLESFLRVLDRLNLAIELVPRDESVRRYREEREAAKGRDRGSLFETIEAARVEYENAIAQGRPTRRPA